MKINIPETKYAEVVFNRIGYVVGVIWQIQSDKSGDEFGTGWRVKTIADNSKLRTDICSSRQAALDWFAAQGVV